MHHIFAIIVSMAALLLCLISPREVEASEGVDVAHRCWTRETFKPLKQSPVSSATLCFKNDGTIDGFAFEHQDGWDFSRKWTSASSKLIIQSEESPQSIHPEICDYYVSADDRDLIMDGCDYKGSWHYDAKMTIAVFPAP